VQASREREYKWKDHHDADERQDDQIKDTDEYSKW
jgi:hypothetical protein